MLGMCFSLGFRGVTDMARLRILGILR